MTAHESRKSRIFTGLIARSKSCDRDSSSPSENSRLLNSFRSENKRNHRPGVSYPARGGRLDLIPLPHPSGASPWHRISPGRELLQQALMLIVRHEAFMELKSE